MIFFILIAAIVVIMIAVILFRKRNKLPEKNSRVFKSFIPIEGRKKIYIDLLKRMKNGDIKFGFCLQIAFIRRTSVYAVFISDLPELMQYCPEKILKNCYYVGADYWFDRENTQIRINILKRIIKDLKKYDEYTN